MAVPVEVSVVRATSTLVPPQAGQASPAAAPPPALACCTSWQEVVDKANAMEDSLDSNFEECALNLQELPRFQPPNFSSPLPVPDSPEPTPEPTPLSVVPAIDCGQRSTLSCWSEVASKEQVMFSLWPQEGEDGTEAEVCRPTGSSKEDHSRTPSAAAPGWLDDIPKDAEYVAEGPYSYSISDGEECHSVSNSVYSSLSTRCLVEQMGVKHELDIADAVSQTDELSRTKLVFPEVEFGAMLALESNARMQVRVSELAPLPGDVPTPLGLSCSFTVGIVSITQSLIDTACEEEQPPDSPEFAWFLPVPESPDPTPAVASGSGSFSWAPAPELQDSLDRSLARFLGAGGSTGGTGEPIVDAAPCSPGGLDEDHDHDVKLQDTEDHVGVLGQNELGRLKAMGWPLPTEGR